MFLKDQFYLLKNFDSEQNVCVSAENQNLIQENASKIKILVENHTFDHSNSKLKVSE